MDPGHRDKAMRSFIALIALCSALSAAANDRLQDLFERAWAFELEAEPVLATMTGVHDYGDRLPLVAPTDQQRKAVALRAFLAELDDIDVASLTPTDRTSYEMFEQRLGFQVAAIEARSFEMPINAEGGFHTSIAMLPSRIPMRHRADAEAYLARLKAIGPYFDAQIANLRRGLDRGFSQPRVILDGFDHTISTHLVDDATTSVFYAPLERLPDSIAPSTRRALSERAIAVIEETVIPAYAQLLSFIRDHYIPTTRESLGASALPGGADFYSLQIKRHTSLDLDARSVHEIGLDEVTRIKSAMHSAMRRAGHDGDLRSFITHLRETRTYYPSSPQALLERAAFIAKAMDGKLPQLFGRLPRLPYTIDPVPESIAPKYTAGRYVSAPRGSTLPGTYWLNTHALDTRPFYNLEALTFHEAVPGHHLQLALQAEIEGLPAFRSVAGVTAFVEGWALYAESLGLEVGFYEDPVNDFGRLGYEMWRACRLVIDTGIHAFGWTRADAIDYLASHTALPLHEVTTEIDRYIGWPGQALAYKLGELKIQELRRRAEDALGKAFDLRAFHDAVLEQGAVPLDVLERHIERWVEEQASGAL